MSSSLDDAQKLAAAFSSKTSSVVADDGKIGFRKVRADVPFNLHAGALPPTGDRELQTAGAAGSSLLPAPPALMWPQVNDMFNKCDVCKSDNLKRRGVNCASYRTSLTGS